MEFVGLPSNVLPPNSIPLRMAYSYDWGVLAWMFPQGILVFYPSTRSLAFHNGGGWCEGSWCEIGPTTPLVLAVGALGHVVVAKQVHGQGWHIHVGESQASPKFGFSVTHELAQQVWSPQTRLPHLRARGPISPGPEVYWGREVLRFLRWQLCHGSSMKLPDLPGGVPRSFSPGEILVDSHPILDVVVGYRRDSGLALHHKMGCYGTTLSPSPHPATWTRLGGRVLGNLAGASCIDTRSTDGRFRTLQWEGANHPPNMEFAMEDFAGDVWIPTRGPEGKMCLASVPEDPNP